MNDMNNTTFIIVVIAAYFAYTFFVRQRKKNMITRKLMESPKIIDVRDPAEFATGAYPGAVNIPLDQLEGRAEELIDSKSRPVIVYCASGMRSRRAARILKAQGFTDVNDGGALRSMPN